jgi:hypothetical protein
MDPARQCGYVATSCRASRFPVHVLNLTRQGASLYSTEGLHGINVSDARDRSLQPFKELSTLTTLVSRACDR